MVSACPTLAQKPAKTQHETENRQAPEPGQSPDSGTDTPAPSDEPERQGEPETPEEPDEPEQQGEPETPEEPDEPEQQGEPETPDEPDEPEQHGEPETPDEPEEPEQQDEPETPEEPDEPERQGEPETPEEPDEPEPEAEPHYEREPEAEPQPPAETSEDDAEAEPSEEILWSEDEELFAQMGSFDDDNAEKEAKSGASAPGGVHLHGSLENQLTGLLLRRPGRSERLSLHDYTRLRIDVDADLPGGVQVRTDAVSRLFVGETLFDLRDLIPERTLDDAIARDPAWAAVVASDAFTYSLQDELYIDNAYLKIPAGPLLVSLGKQPLEQGAGYVWNPTDVFIEKEMFDPTYEKEGVVSLRVMIPLGETASLDLAVAPQNAFEKWTAGGRARLRLGPLTLGPAAYITRIGGDPEQLLPIADARRVMVGGDAVLDVEGIRFWTEGANNFVDDEPEAPEDWWELSAGVEYFFTFETHLMAEYYHYGRGPQQREGLYSLEDWMGLLATELRGLGQDLIFVSVDHPIADFWTVGLSSIGSFTDLSATVMADLRWEFVQDGEIWLLLAGSAGEPEDFLSSGVGQGWIRVKVYF